MCYGGDDDALRMSTSTTTMTMTSSSMSPRYPGDGMTTPPPRWRSSGGGGGGGIFSFGGVGFGSGAADDVTVTPGMTMMTSSMQPRCATPGSQASLGTKSQTKSLLVVEDGFIRLDLDGVEVGAWEGITAMRRLDSSDGI